MQSAHPKKLLDDFLSPLVHVFGFSRASTLLYVRPQNEATAIMSFPFRWDGRGFAAFTCGVGVRFETLARWLDDDPSDIRATLGAPIHFLRDDRSFTEWKFATAEELECLHQPISSDLARHATPFLAKYSHLHEAIKTIASTNPWNWFNWDVHSRVKFLAAVELIDGKKADAIRILDEALRERENSLPKHRFEIEWFRRKVVAKE